MDLSKFFDITPNGTYVQNGDGVVGTVAGVTMPTIENGLIRPIYHVADSDGVIYDHVAVYEILED